MTQELDQTQKLAQKNTRATAFLTLFFPLLGYIYTGRYKALLVSLGIFVGVAGICIAGDPNLEDEEDFILGLQVLYGVGTALENSRAVSQAKKRLQEPKFPAINPDRQKIQLLRLAKAQGEVTLADCVLEINCSAAEVRLLLDELQREDLMIVGNRERDGAVVYRII
ncbi:hypothetical protein VB834_08025 [Limnoraphis robusta Tam1]|uniref:HTH deoR-type domain-containing protein n=1 Tax=Limnoraphis robusta CCNP1315 TaxID=3110306 RepID=A0ABU5TSQ4_9CYAN|nr:hypothetical protein [Limnoraphis robusta]MEA5498636.1 hypothetical protein [Limnoraphis robusta BA-68 BA1]MEA5517925.1 hypothetical protein [Limnoraphis robusta CCNP1315]MEA5538977.1 hypothetical protein [Limnoraphis robusta Tam1]MEA5543734.1 hypothetical protein [Limnoraphis robusta CCNP1324]